MPTSRLGATLEETMVLLRLLQLLLIATSFSQPAFAQINPFRGRATVPLQRDDISALTDATHRLLNQTGLVAGQSATWSSPSGASGEVTAGNAVHRHGFSCRI